MYIGQTVTSTGIFINLLNANDYKLLRSAVTNCRKQQCNPNNCSARDSLLTACGLSRTAACTRRYRMNTHKKILG